MDRFNEMVSLQCPECATAVEQSMRWLFHNPNCAQCGADMTSAVNNFLNDVDPQCPWPQVQQPVNKAFV